MNIRRAEPVEAEKITRKLWLPLAREMEEVSEYNRLAEDLDLEAIIEHREEELHDEKTFTFLAEEDELAGFATGEIRESPPIFERGKYLKLKHIFVREDHRRKGIASRLMDKLEEIARREGCSSIELEVDVPNTAGREFYTNRGFEPERKRMVKNL